MHPNRLECGQESMTSTPPTQEQELLCKYKPLRPGYSYLHAHCAPRFALHRVKTCLAYTPGRSPGPDITNCGQMHVRKRIRMNCMLRTIHEDASLRLWTIRLVDLSRRPNMFLVPLVFQRQEHGTPDCLFERFYRFA
jgi:hypothetical protein